MSNRGRRKTYAPSASKLLLKRSAAEAGLDDNALKEWTEATVEIFPDYRWQSHLQQVPPDSEEVIDSTLSPRDVSIIQKARDLHATFRRSTHYIRVSQHIMDQYEPGPKADESIIQSLQATSHYFPLELLQESDTKLAPGKATPVKRKTNLDALEQKEKAKNVKKTEQEDDNLIYDSVDDEEGEDYTMNYYASDDESEADGNEAVF